MPCKRCVNAGLASECTRAWEGRYDPAIHRQYPRSKTSPSRSSRQNPDPPVNVVDLSTHDETESVVVVSPDVSAIQNPGPVSKVYGQPPASEVQPSNIRARSSEIACLQSLLPTTANIFQLVQYYENRLSWQYWSFCAPLFRKDLIRALQPTGVIQLSEVDLRWAAVLFAVLAASMTCSDEATARFWGYAQAEKRALERKWFDASVSCLHLSRYMARPHLHSVQTIVVLSISAHLQGQSSEFFILYGVAIRLAQKLGLQRLAFSDGLDSLDGVNDARKDVVRRRELGRRLWTQLQIHDSFTVAMTDMFLIQQRHCRAILPRQVDDENLTLVPDSTPHFAQWAAWLAKLSGLVAQCHDALSTDDDDETKYRSVLLFDSKMRGLRLPPPFQAASNDDWCRYARQEEIIVRANKIAFIHRRFLGPSFKDDRYAYSRWASVDAARSLIREVEAALNAESTRPTLWNDQAHMIGACITLCLDLFHRSEADPEAKEDHKALNQALSVLSRQEESVLAAQGTRLISLLLKDGRARLGQHHTNLADDEAFNWPVEGQDALDAIRQIVMPKEVADDGLNSTGFLRNGVAAGNGQNLSTPDTQDDIFAHESWPDIVVGGFSPENDLENIMLLNELFP